MRNACVTLLNNVFISLSIVISAGVLSTFSYVCKTLPLFCNLILNPFLQYVYGV